MPIPPRRVPPLGTIGAGSRFVENVVMSTGAKDLDARFSWRGEAGRSTSNVFRTPTLSSMDVGGRLQRAFPSAPHRRLLSAGLPLNARVGWSVARRIESGGY